MISRTGLYALKALAVLIQLPEGKFVGAATIAQEIGAPQNYLGKLLRTLASEGIVESQKGIGGGFCITIDPEKTSLYQVLEPIEEVSRWSGCFLGKTTCSSTASCALHSKWKKARDSYLVFLKETTLAQL